MKDIRAQILWWAAKQRLERDRPLIIAVTGSIAKTSTKEAIGAVLQPAYPNQVRVGYGNLNTYLGLPLAILGFQLDFHRRNLGLGWMIVLLQAFSRAWFNRIPKYLILELAADRPGEIRPMVDNLPPISIAVITLVGPAHLMNYQSVEAIAAEKASLLSGLKPDGLALLNENDPYLKVYRRKFTGPIKLFSCPIGEIAETVARLIGERLGISDTLISQSLQVRSHPSGRLNRQRVGEGELIDDSYNANPLSMVAALELLSKLPNRRVTILGEMRELGQQEREFHRQVGSLARRQADFLIGIGELAKEYQPNQWFADSATAAEEILAYLKPDDSILVKGSRAMKMEQIVRAISSRPLPVDEFSRRQ